MTHDGDDSLRGAPAQDTAADTAASAELAVAAARDAGETAAAEEAPTCDHNWRLCPFYCRGCNTTFAISDEPVAWRRRVRAFQGNVEPVEPGDFNHWTLITELAAWSESEDPPLWP